MGEKKSKVSKKTVNSAKRAVKKTAKKYPKLVLAIAVVLIVVIVGLIVGAYFYTDGDFSRLPYLLGLKEEVSPPPSFGAAGQLAIYCIDVGQGNSALIAFPDGKFMLIDAGNTRTDAVDGTKARDTLFSTIESVIGDGEIDYLLATHPDADHVNLLDDVLEEYSVKTVIYNDSRNKTATYQKFVDAASEEPDCEIVKIDGDGFLSGGNEYEINGTYGAYSYEVTVYAAGYDTFNNKANDMSPVVVLEYGGFEGIIYGDGTTATEEWWVNYIKETDSVNEFDIDFLYVAHHGSSSSSGAEFLEFVKAEYAVISCGEGNTYGHPTSSVMSRLDSLGVATYRTDKHGTTVVAVSPDGSFGFLPKNNVPMENNSVGREGLLITAGNAA